MANFTEKGYFEKIQAVSCSMSRHGNHDLYSIAAFNIILSIAATLGNILILIALSKDTSLHPPSKLLYRCLTVTDLCVGLLSQPLFAIQLLSMAHQRLQFCYIYVTLSVNDLVGRSFSGVSLLTMTAISVDRLLALLLGLRYRQIVTLKRTRGIVVFMWILSVSISILWRFWSQGITQKLISALICTTLVSSALCYMKIYLSLRHHQVEIQEHVHQGQPNEGRTPLNIARYRKTVSTALWVQLTLVACYLPYGITTALVNPFSPLHNLPKRITITLVYLNSSLNPILYCWKIRGVRKGVKDTIRWMYFVVCPA